MSLKNVIEKIIDEIPHITSHYGMNDSMSEILADTVAAYMETVDSPELDFSFLKGMIWERVALGNVSSYDILNYNELVLFKFYELNTDRYKKIMDMGANAGLHTIICSRLGYDVLSVEPNPVNYEMLKSNCEKNSITPNLLTKAVSDIEEEVEFVHLEGNFTGSHIKGAKDYYGGAKVFKVQTVRYEDTGFDADLIKMDIEGSESRVIKAMPAEIWQKTDALIEIHDEANRSAIYEHFRSIGINMFPQKIQWKKAENGDDLPKIYSEGVLFVSASERMPWG